MTDSLVAQREARRQRLMKNAENRMNRLRSRPQNEADDIPSPDIELKNIDLKEQLETQNDRTDNQQNNEIRTNSPYNLRHRTSQLHSKPGEEAQESARSETKISSAPSYEIVEDPEVPSLAEFLAKQEAAKLTGVNNRQATFDPSVPRFPPKRVIPKGPDREKQLEYVRVTGLFFTALVTRWFLTYDAGYNLFMLEGVVGSMFFPFLLFEVFLAFAAQKFVPGVSLAPVQGSLLTTALMLCGIRPELIQFYIRSMARVTAFSNDLFLYMFAFILCHLVLGSP